MNKTEVGTLAEQVSAILTPYALMLAHMEGISRTLKLIEDNVSALVRSPEDLTKVTDLLNEQISSLGKVVDEITE